MNPARQPEVDLGAAEHRKVGAGIDCLQASGRSLGGPSGQEGDVGLRGVVERMRRDRGGELSWLPQDHSRRHAERLHHEALEGGGE